MTTKIISAAQWFTDVWPEKYQATNQNVKAAIWLTAQEMRDTGLEDKEMDHLWGIAGKSTEWDEVKNWSEETANKHIGCDEQEIETEYQEEYEEESEENIGAIATRTLISASFQFNGKLGELGDKPVITLTPNNYIRQLIKSNPNAVVTGFKPTGYCSTLPFSVEASVCRSNDLTKSIMHPIVISPSDKISHVSQHEIDLIDNGKKNPPIGFKYDNPTEIMSELQKKKSEEHGLSIEYCVVPIGTSFGKFINGLDAGLTEIDSELGNYFLIDTKTTENLAKIAVDEVQKKFNYVTIKNFALTAKPAFTDLETDDKKIEELVQYKLDEKGQKIETHMNGHHHHRSIKGNANVKIDDNNIWISKSVKERYGEKKINETPFTLCINGLLSIANNTLNN